MAGKFSPAFVEADASAARSGTVVRRVEIVVVYNEPDTLKNSFLKSSALEAAEPVLIDNTTLARPLPAIFNEHKRTSQADWIVFCHQDFIVFDAAWIARILALPEDACYGPIGVDSHGRFLGRIQQTDGSFLGYPANGADVVGLDEQCLIVPRSIYSLVDFDERFPFDLYVHDYCLSAKRAGFKIKTFQLDCQHRSKTLTGDVTRPAYFAAKKAYLAKHRDLMPLVTTTFAFRPRYFTPVSNPTLAEELRLIPDRSRVLEIGTAAGHMTRALAEKHCQVTGIELDPDLGRFATQFCTSMIVGDVENLDIDGVLSADFDVILCGDVLEHLKDPAAVLQKLTRKLRPHGYFVVSLPNIAHASVRLSLLAGKFTYVPEGLLDATHLRFFTLESICKLLTHAGLVIHDLRRRRIGVFDTEIAIDPNSVSASILKRVIRDPESTTYQYIFRAAPSTAGNEPAHLQDSSYDPTEQRRLLARACLEQAWIAFHREPARDTILARTWTRLSLAIRPSAKAVVYWGASLLPSWLLRRFAPETSTA